jgi:hypothetical protein
VADERGLRDDEPTAGGTAAATSPAGPRSLLASPYAPVILALGLALVSSPVVAWSLTLPPEDWRIGESGWVPVDGASAMLLALAAVIPAALVGGLLGGLVRSRWLVLGAFVAVWVSWAIGIMMLPVAASTLGVTLRIGVFCLDACTATLRDGGLDASVEAYGTTLLGGAMFVLPAVIGGVLAIVAAVAGRRHAVLAGVVLAVLAQGAVHIWSLAMGGLAAWLCLAAGVVIWSMALPRSAIRPPAPRAVPPAWGPPPDPVPFAPPVAAEPPPGSTPAAPPPPPPGVAS